MPAMTHTKLQTLTIITIDLPASINAIAVTRTVFLITQQISTVALLKLDHIHFAKNGCRNNHFTGNFHTPLVVAAYFSDNLGCLHKSNIYSFIMVSFLQPAPFATGTQQKSVERKQAAQDCGTKGLLRQGPFKRT